MLNQIIDSPPPGAGIGIARRVESKRTEEIVRNSKTHWLIAPMGQAPNGILQLTDRALSVAKLLRGRLTPLYTVPVQYNNHTEAALNKRDTDDEPEFLYEDKLAGYQMLEVTEAYPREVTWIRCLTGVSQEVVQEIEALLLPIVPANLVDFGKRLGMLESVLAPRKSGVAAPDLSTLPKDVLAIRELNPDHKKLVVTLVGELKDAVKKAWEFANEEINKTEREQVDASNGKPGKSQLTPQDYFYYAMTNRIPAHGDKVVVSTPQDTKNGAVEVSAMGKKECPDCAELIMEKARKCRHCGFQFQDEPKGKK